MRYALRRDRKERATRLSTRKSPIARSRLPARSAQQPQPPVPGEDGKSEDSGQVKRATAALPMDESTTYAVKARTEMVHRILEGLRDEALELATDVGIESLAAPGGLRDFIDKMRSTDFLRAADNPSIAASSFPMSV